MHDGSTTELYIVQWAQLHTKHIQQATLVKFSRRLEDILIAKIRRYVKSSVN
jgi:hypothetical protein